MKCSACKCELPDGRKCARCRECDRIYQASRRRAKNIYGHPCSCGADIPPGRNSHYCAHCATTYMASYTKDHCSDCGDANVLKGRTRCRHCQTVWNKAHYDPVQSKQYMSAYWAENAQYYRDNARKRRATLKGARVVKRVSLKSVISKCGDCCQYCGADTSHGNRQIDHILPLSRGGTHEESNLQVLCAKCNRAKSAMTMEEFVAAQEGVIAAYGPVSVIDPRGGHLQSPAVTGEVPFQ